MGAGREEAWSVDGLDAKPICVLRAYVQLTSLNIAHSTSRLPGRESGRYSTEN